MIIYELRGHQLLVVDDLASTSTAEKVCPIELHKSNISMLSCITQLRCFFSVLTYSYSQNGTEISQLFYRVQFRDKGNFFKHFL